MIKSHLRRRHSLIVAYFTLNREIKKRRGRKNSRIPRENIEEDHYEGKSTTWTHTQLSSTPTFLWPVARAYGYWERERKEGGIIRDTARTRPRRTRWSGMKKVLRGVGGFVGARKEIPRWESRSKKPTVSAFPALPPSSSGQLSINLRP